MTTDEIKQSVSMREVAERYGYHLNRAGFISCPFHQGDRTPSMKIYKRDYHCHACGNHGDVFTFVMGMDNCDFKTAFKKLGGTYKKQNDYQRKLSNYRFEKAKEKRKQEELKNKQEKSQLLRDIDILKLCKQLYPPFSDEWCDAVNQLEVKLYRLSYLTERRQ